MAQRAWDNTSSFYDWRKIELGKKTTVSETAVQFRPTFLTAEAFDFNMSEVSLVAPHRGISRLIRRFLKTWLTSGSPKNSKAR